jgi:hypothetical protein
LAATRYFPQNSENTTSLVLTSKLFIEKAWPTLATRPIDLGTMSVRVQTVTLSGFLHEARGRVGWRVRMSFREPEC